MQEDNTPLTWFRSLWADAVMALTDGGGGGGEQTWTHVGCHFNAGGRRYRSSAEVNSRGRRWKVPRLRKHIKKNSFRLRSEPAERANYGSATTKMSSLKEEEHQLKCKNTGISLHGNSLTLPHRSIDDAGLDRRSLRPTAIGLGRAYTGGAAGSQNSFSSCTHNVSIIH